ncbi:MAG: alpha-L-rhamnosidase C-terminal domain-containing protein [Rhodanobacter sp.]
MILLLLLRSISSFAARTPVPVSAEPSWQSYVMAPASRHVLPVTVVAVHGSVDNPKGMVGPGTITLRRKPPLSKPSWPQGTRAASDPGNTLGKSSTSHPPAAAIDGSLTTYWQGADDKKPDAMTIRLPNVQWLAGITLQAAPGHVIPHFQIQIWNNKRWQVAAVVTGNRDLQRAVTFKRPSRTSQIRLTVIPEADSRAAARVAAIWPGVIHDDPPPSVVLDFGKLMAGDLHVVFAGASKNHPGVRLAFSATRQYLGERSDFTRSDNGDSIVPGTDQWAVPSSPSSWTDVHGCVHGHQLCADGLHGFRYVKISLDALPDDAPYAEPYGRVVLQKVWLDFTPYLGTPSSYTGWFLSSDPQLNRYWYGASYTDELNNAIFRADNIEPREADSAFLEGKRVLLDGAKRDRDPYVGDLAVSALTAYLTHGPDLQGAAQNVLLDLAHHQRADGWIAPASIRHYTLPLFDYPMWWVADVWDNVLYTADRGFAATSYPYLRNVLDHWYPSVTNAHGLLEKGLNGTSGYGDYAFLPRSGEVTYYNALYVLALRDAAHLAEFMDHHADAERWSKRAHKVSRAINERLWDAKAGAYLDAAKGPTRHGQDGNAIAVLSGVADGQRARSLLDYLTAHTALPYGNAFMDNESLIPKGDHLVYPFTSYFDIEARFLSGRTSSAIDEIRRLYGWMANHGPKTTDWEGVGTGGSLYERGYTSTAHGWSTGVVPLLSNDLLGARPIEPGFKSWLIKPHPGSVAWARGALPTPHGPLQLGWIQHAGGMQMTLTVPSGTSGTIALPSDVPAKVWMDGQLAWDGKHALEHEASTDGGYIELHHVGGGSHRIALAPIALKQEK